MYEIAWTDHVNKWKDCQLCPLCKQRDRIVLARGTIPCDVLIVGEAPGSSEDTIGQPFIGPAGHLLDQIIERAVPASISVLLTNLVACFPREAKARGDNEPTDKEIITCRPRLIELVNIACPRLIVCVGALSAGYVDHDDTVKCVDIIHPSAILRNPPNGMPLVKKRMAIQKCVVTVQCAVDVMLREQKPFEEWGKRYAGATTRRQQLRATYDSADTRPGDDGIPF